MRPHLSCAVTREELESIKEAAWLCIHIAPPDCPQAKHCYPKVAVIKGGQPTSTELSPSLRPRHGQMCPGWLCLNTHIGSAITLSFQRNLRMGRFKRPTSGGEYRHLYKTDRYNSEKILLRLEPGETTWLKEADI